MKVKGSFEFDVPNAFHHVISKDCKIDIPDKVPIVCEFDRTHMPIGFANVTRTNEGLIFEGDVVTNKNLCDSCKTKNCIFQLGIVRNHCDFYRAESEETE